MVQNVGPRAAMNMCSRAASLRDRRGLKYGSKRWGLNMRSRAASGRGQRSHPQNKKASSRAKKSPVCKPKKKVLFTDENKFRYLISDVAKFLEIRENCGNPRNPRKIVGRVQGGWGPGNSRDLWAGAPGSAWMSPRISGSARQSLEPVRSRPKNFRARP